MTDPLTTIVNSQAPWMVLCVVLVLSIVKLQNDKLTQLCVAIANLATALANHDSQTMEIKSAIKEISKWTADHGPKICEMHGDLKAVLRRE